MASVLFSEWENVPGDPLVLRRRLPRGSEVAREYHRANIERIMRKAQEDCDPHYQAIAVLEKHRPEGRLSLSPQKEILDHATSGRLCEAQKAQSQTEG
jgi:hypothetical protein